MENYIPFKSDEMKLSLVGVCYNGWGSRYLGNNNSDFLSKRIIGLRYKIEVMDGAIEFRCNSMYLMTCAINAHSVSE